MQPPRRLDVNIPEFMSVQKVTSSNGFEGGAGFGKSLSQGIWFVVDYPTRMDVIERIDATPLGERSPCVPPSRPSPPGQV